MSYKKFAPEWKRTVDTLTGNTVIQWTDSVAKDQHLYFTTPSVTQDDRWLVFISERNSHPNLYGIIRPEGDIYQLTYNEKGLMRSYAYPLGGMDGLSKASPCLDPIRNRLYWIAGDQVRRLDLDTGNQEVLCNLPERWYTAYNHISSDGRFLCVPCTPQEAFPGNMADQWEQLRTVPKVMLDQKLVTRLYRIDTNTGHMDIWTEVPFWVTHVQFDPLLSKRLIFNKEGYGDFSTPRIWCLESDGAYRPLFNQARNSVCSHESWSPTGRFVIYHGWTKTGIPIFGARTWEGKIVYQIPISEFSRGHVTSTLDGLGFISDGIDSLITLVTLRGEKGNGFTAIIMGLCGFWNRRRIKRLFPGVHNFFMKRVLGWLEGRLVRKRHLCKHDTTTSLLDQDAHVHTSITPRGQSVIFTSDRDGTCNVYEVLIGV